MRVFALVVLLSLALPVHLFSQANFFEGKTIKIAAGLPAGDAYDLYARIWPTTWASIFPAIPTLSSRICRARRV